MATKNKTIRQVIWAALKRNRRFADDDRGVTMIEFALLSLPFFAIVGAILETSLVFLASQILDSAVNDSARLIRTGRSETLSYTMTEYREAVCDKLYGMFDCSAVKIKVTEVASFSTASVDGAADPDDASWLVVENYDDGSGSSIILVEAYYKWPIILNLYDFNLSNLPDNTRMLSAVRVFRNEPF